MSSLKTNIKIFPIKKTVFIWVAVRIHYVQKKGKHHTQICYNFNQLWNKTGSGKHSRYQLQKNVLNSADHCMNYGFWELKRKPWLQHLEFYLKRLDARISIDVAKIYNQKTVQLSFQVTGLPRCTINGFTFSISQPTNRCFVLSATRAEMRLSNYPQRYWEGPLLKIRNEKGPRL